MAKWKIKGLALLLALSLTACASNEPTAVTEESTVTQETDAVATSEATAASEETAATQSAEKTESAEAPEVTESFQSLFAKYGMKAGTCLSDYMIRNENCLEIIKTNFNSITFENLLKPDYILDKQASQNSGELVVTFNDSTISLLDWCRENGMEMRGHTLVWYSQTPSWIFYENFDTNAELVSREVMLTRMESYIRQVFEQLESLGYLELFYAYDVVNEAWMEDGTMRDCLWLNTIGDDYIWYAFHYANMYAPDYIDLYYNDYNEQYKMNTLYDFVQTLVDEEGNYLIDGIGFQAHLYTEDNIDQYLKTVERLGSTGLKVNLTELEVSLGTWQDIKPATEENLKIQGQYYYNLIGGILKLVEEGKVKMDALTFWGFADQLSWRKERNPLFFDAAYKPKYALYGALQMKEYAGFEQ